MATTRAELDQQMATEDRITAEYDAACDKARATCEAAIDRIKAEGGDLAKRRIEVAIEQMVLTQSNAANARREALRKLPWRRDVHA